MSKLWNFWAKRYHKLWVQKWVLGPTREEILQRVDSMETPPGNILDFGCGTGQLAKSLGRHIPGSQITGFDPTPEMIRLAENGEHPVNISFSTDLDTHAAERYDLIISTHSFPYVRDQQGTLKDFHRMLKPGGKVFIVMSHFDRIQDYPAMLLVKMTTINGKYLPLNRILKMAHSAGFEEMLVYPLALNWFVPSIYFVGLTKV